ncbi:hypothetical protein [Amycolatopsis balhimycina]|nr:hypothetical protein [Amycolatopsis balhimycina]
MLGVSALMLLIGLVVIAGIVGVVLLIVNASKPKQPPYPGVTPPGSKP